jgi:hypothetical protein
MEAAMVALAVTVVVRVEGETAAETVVVAV